MYRIFIVAWVALGVVPAAAQSSSPGHCRDDKLSNTNGIVIALTSGLAYRAFPGSQPRMANWMPLDKVTVCQIGGAAVRITNDSRKYQSVKALRIFSNNSGALM